MKPIFSAISQLESLVEEVLDDIVRHRPGELIRIWSMPCSSGEEPYSIVLFLLEHWPKLEQVDIEIIASDIDTCILQKQHKVFSVLVLLKIYPIVLSTNISAYGLMAVTN